jgi:hypothetical protein
MQTSQVHIVYSLSHIFESLVCTRDADGYVKVNITELVMLKKLFLFATMGQLEDYLMITTESNYQHFFAKNFHLSSSGS